MLCRVDLIVDAPDNYSITDIEDAIMDSLPCEDICLTEVIDIEEI